MEAGTEIGSYIIDKPLGEGGMAQVYLAHHAHLKSKHAIKVLLPELLRDEELRMRFLGEGQIQAQLRHPNIVPVTDVVSVPGVAGLVMDFVDGITLEEFIQQNPSPNVETVRHLFLQILDAIGFAHENGVVHRDIKPSNVLISTARDGSLLAQVLDFGIAKVFEAEGRAATRTGMRMGTPQYMSPEQVRGMKDVDHRSDIFSLGALLYEMASGEAAFDGASEFDIQIAITQENYRPLESLPAESKAAFGKAIAGALKVDKAQRFQSCEELAKAVGGADFKPVQRPQSQVLTPPTPSTVQAGQAALAGGSASLAGLKDNKQLWWAAGGVLVFLVAWGMWGGDKAPEGMIRIPGGSFEMGSIDGDDDEKPVTRVRLDEYFIDRTPVTVAAYRACVDAGECELLKTVSDDEWCNYGQADKDEHPINCVNWFQAKAFCEWKGGRLPTEAEWEYAARGGDGRKYPWGNEEPNPRLANACGPKCAKEVSEKVGFEWGALYDTDDGWITTSPVGSFPAGASSFGLQDMAGNVLEWVGDRYKDSYPGGSVQNPQGPASGSSGVLRAGVLRGGSWSSGSAFGLRAGIRDWYLADNWFISIGFRCARGAVFD